MSRPSYGTAMNSTPPQQKLGRFSLPKFRRAPPTTTTKEDALPTSSDPPHAEPEISSLMSETNLSRSTSSPDPFLVATLDPDYIQLREHIRRLRRVPLGSDTKSVDAAWDVYKNLREESLGYCRKLIHKSRGRNPSLESSISPLDMRSSYSGGSNYDASLYVTVNSQWASAIRDHKKIQDVMLKAVYDYLKVTYNNYEPEFSQRHFDAFLADKDRRKYSIAKWQDGGGHRLKSERPEFFDKYKTRLSVYDKLKQDVEESERLCDVLEAPQIEERVVRETIITRGDTILEFTNRPSDDSPILRFRVSSHVLVDASPLFSHMLLPRSPEVGTPLDMLNDLPRAPSKFIAKDGTEVKVYQMPQTEPNNHEALTILLHAAHAHGVPEKIQFPVFVSIADVCLRYQCTSPLELQVRFQWLPDWEAKAAQDNPYELLLIAYVFGKRDVFTRTSRSIILNARDDSEIHNKQFLPKNVREKIKAIRAAKIAQVYECCTNLVEEYLPRPVEQADRPAYTGSLKLTTSPRCPRRSHICDATNLGSLMQVFNELRVLPNFWKSTRSAPRRTLRELIDCLRLMPSPPQSHSGVCDYAPAFRRSINDIANSILGLTLFDVSGQHGWALSKNDPPQNLHADMSVEIYELPALVKPETTVSIALSTEAITLRILSYLDTLEELQAVAMIDKNFYGAYKRNELYLLRNIVKAKTKSETSTRADYTLPPKSRLVSDAFDHPPDAAFLELVDDSESVVSDLSGSISSIAQGDELHSNPSSPLPMVHDAMPLSEEEAHNLLTLNVEATSRAYVTKRSQQLAPRNGQYQEVNEKFLAGDFAHVDDKIRLGEDDMAKQLREEKEKVLGQVKGL
ncbi:nuclear pore protein [Rutstroemia sp. NJR-2017a WRK4]|nr:nuclear pore protein [Rutstroemia sp. NJR-2017a WRK4]